MNRGREARLSRPKLPECAKPFKTKMYTHRIDITADYRRFRPHPHLFTRTEIGRPYDAICFVCHLAQTIECAFIDAVVHLLLFLYKRVCDSTAPFTGPRQ